MNNYIIDSLWLAASSAINNRDIQGAKEVLEALESAQVSDQVQPENDTHNFIEDDSPEFVEANLDCGTRKVNSKLAFLFDQQKYIEKFFQQPSVNPQDFSVAELRSFLIKTVNTRIWREYPDWTNRLRNLFRYQYANPASDYFKGFVSLGERGRYRVREDYMN